MRKIIFVLLYGILWGVLPLRAQKLVPAIKPNATQQAMQKRAYGMFIHFGINTFCQQEWSDGSIPALTYNPTNLNCEQWVRVARDAGFRYVLLVTKHHDGFVYGIVPLRHMMLLLLLTRQILWLKFQKLAVSMDFSLLSIIRYGIVRSLHSMTKIRQSILILCVVNLLNF